MIFGQGPTGEKNPTKTKLNQNSCSFPFLFGNKFVWKVWTLPQHLKNNIQQSPFNFFLLLEADVTSRWADEVHYLCLKTFKVFD